MTNHPNRSKRLNSAWTDAAHANPREAAFLAFVEANHAAEQAYAAAVNETKNAYWATYHAAEDKRSPEVLAVDREYNRVKDAAEQIFLAALAAADRTLADAEARARG